MGLLCCDAHTFFCELGPLCLLATKGTEELATKDVMCDRQSVDVNARSGLGALALKGSGAVF